MYARILVPVDVNEPEVAREALASASAMASAFHSALRLVCVVSPIAPGSPMAFIPQKVYDEMGGAEKRQLETLAGRLGAPGGVSCAVRVGAVYPELIAEAESWGADVIIVGAHRRSMATLLIGSTAAALTRHAKCTVMVVRSPIKAKLI